MKKICPYSARGSVAIGPFLRAAFLVSILISGLVDSKIAWADARMLPPSTEESRGNANPTACSGAYGSQVLTWDGGNALACATGVAAAGGTITLNPWGPGNAVNINGNQVWNTAGYLYLNYSSPGGVVNVGSGGAQQDLTVNNGYLGVRTLGASGNQFSHITGNQMWNDSGQLYFNAWAPAGQVVIGGGTPMDLNIPNGQICLNGVCSRTLGGGNPINMYQCPGVVSLGGGAWGFYGCQGQITNSSTCYEIEYPNSRTFPCNYVGKMMLQP